MTPLRIAALAVAVLAACSPPTDLDSSCRLMVADPSVDGGYDLVTPSELDPDAGFDFIATGDTDCSSFVCLRVALPAPGFYDDSDGVAHGRCSESCTTSTDCAGTVSALSCQQLGPDEGTLGSYCSANPASCTAMFGAQPSASYCVDPTASVSAGG